MTLRAPQEKPHRRIRPRRGRRNDPPRSAACAGGPPRAWRSIWISDLHLGTRACQAELLFEFLRDYRSEHLYLVGDVVDGWSLRRAWYWNETHNRVLRTLLEASARDTQVTYVTGNHDEFLRVFGGLSFGAIQVKEEAVHRTADGRELLVRHGDDFDLLVRNARWLTRLGDRAIALSRLAGRALDLVRRALRRPPWSLADWLRSRVKRALLYVERFEEAAAAEARRRGLDGIVCGHVHHANLREIQGVLYANDGDWVDSCTALVEDWDGKLSILSLARRPAASVQAASR